MGFKRIFGLFLKVGLYEVHVDSILVTGDVHPFKEIRNRPIDCCGTVSFLHIILWISGKNPSTKQFWFKSGQYREIYYALHIFQKASEGGKQLLLTNRWRPIDCPHNYSGVSQRGKTFAQWLQWRAIVATYWHVNKKQIKTQHISVPLICCHPRAQKTRQTNLFWIGDINATFFF